MKNRRFIDRGVIMPEPEAVHIGDEVSADRIAPGVVLHPGTRLEGEALSIGPGSAIGSEGPAVVRDCQLGGKVTLGSGFFDGSVFLDGASMGGGAHVRPGCLLEEEASGAHTVGLKQTILLPFVTLGSLINFCDCLMAGGTSRKDHSEVGSSYIHFNFTPHQDKATGSLIGNVRRGVMLDQAPVFLGGQGGLVGPARVAFGTVVPAGQVIRNDILEPGRLVVPPLPHAGSKHYDAAVYGAVDRLIVNNLHYIAELKALDLWYRDMRRAFMADDAFARACYDGARRVLSGNLKERIKRLGDVIAKFPASIRLLTQRADDRSREHAARQAYWAGEWPAIEKALRADVPDTGTHPGRAALAAALARRAAGQTYVTWVKALDASIRDGGEEWLSTVSEGVIGKWTTTR